MRARSETRIGRAALIAALGLLAVISVGAVPASADVPPYEGMFFPTIHGPDDPEDFSWKVTLHPWQEIKLIDDQTAVVYYKETGDPPVTAFQIVAASAHDANGATVPTTIDLSEGNVITLTVHHRDGDPAAGGAPFAYPVTEGKGWEGGFSTVTVLFPDGVSPLAPAQCLVPMLVGSSLKATRAKLKKSGCNLGKVRGKRSRTANVVRQHREPGIALPASAHVAVRLEG